mmetsp:Transcript_11444/g.29477  ORF Transcript_11444/g.29477 Transcript_11444/m.29477 type:complete len:90 (-) Transcript_11444:611-880(-)
MSSSWEPDSTTRPRSMTMMRSAPRTVERRCAISSTVQPSSRSESARCSFRSLSTSRALVASSNIKILGFFSSARAMATRCFCPPERPLP